MKFNKLVRDNIPDIIADSGQKATFRVLMPSERMEYLEKKLDEEAAEFHESKDIEELADILEIVIAIAAEKGYSVDKLWEARLKKMKSHGGFCNKFLLLEVEEDADHEQREEKELPKRLIYESFSPHDCEAWYSCPYCNKQIGGWSLPSSGDVANGKKMYCPHCKKEVKYPL